MDHVTYRLCRDRQDSRAVSFREVRRLADEVVVWGRDLQSLLADFGAFVEQTGHEQRRSEGECLVEALMLGVLWRARGHEALETHRFHGELLTELLVERQLGMPRRRDGSTAKLLAMSSPVPSGGSAPSLDHVRKLYEWLWATGEYDDEVERLVGWLAFLERTPALASERLRQMVQLAIVFGRASEERLGRSTQRVDSFLAWILPQRPAREDSVQCSRKRIECHFIMVGAELLNRAWRREFQACARRVVVLPGCARARQNSSCEAQRSDTELRCVHCTEGCTVSRATRVAEAAGTEAIAVLHGSDFGRFLRSPRLAGGDVGIVGVACVPGLVGADWRARNRGLPAQCVLLDFSGWAHWLERPRPTTLNLADVAHHFEHAPPVKTQQACAA